ncbi:MAG: ABC transporter ATP-binding protein [Deltaproteobacteria bacterium]|nr:ABC transporter ATP-binding protein [Deltaproteobacteria bacterium]
MIEIENLTVRQDGKTLLSGVTLHIKKGEKVALSGASGCGKTTLLKTLIGRYTNDEGSIIIDSHPLTIENLKLIRKKLFYLSQDIKPFKNKTTIEYLKLPFSFLINSDIKFSEEETRNFAKKLLLKEDIFNRPFDTLSGGEKKRVGFLRGLILKRDIFLLDEPTSQIDEDSSTALVELISTMKDKTVLGVTHDKNFMERCDRQIDFASLNLVTTKNSVISGGTNGSK